MKRKKLSNIINVLAFFNFLVAVALVILLRVFQTDEFTRWYSGYNTTLEEYELWIETYGATFLAVVVIMVNYLLKSFLPWFPISCLCVASAVIFKWYIAAAINLAGIGIFFSIRFYRGRKNGGGKAEEILERYDKPHDFIESGKAGSKAVLFFSRLVPGIPLGAVSVFYGSTEIPYGEYLTVSLLGVLYKVFTYITIGRNVFDPASISFVGPFIPLFIVVGFVLLTISGAVTAKNLKKRKSIEK